MKISEAFEEYMNEETLATGGSLCTYEAYKYAMKAFIGFWGDVYVEAITLRNISQFSLQFQKNHSINTARNYIVCLRAVLRMCRRHGVDALDPESIRVPNKTKNIPLCLEEDEIERLIRVAGQSCRGYPELNRVRNTLIIKMLYTTGLRVSELCALNIDDIRNREFVVIGKSKDPRVCFITEEIEEMIHEYLKLRNDHNPALFVSNQTGGERISKKTVQSMFRRVRAKAGIDGVHPHTMRHSFCTHLLEQGVDIRNTALLMGHQSWNTTKIYTHIKNHDLKRIYDNAMN